MLIYCFEICVLYIVNAVDGHFMPQCCSVKLLCNLSFQIAEVIDERPDEVKRLEGFRNSNRWKVIGGNEGNCQLSRKKALPKQFTLFLFSLAADSDVGTPSSDGNPSDSPELSNKKSKIGSSPVRKTRHDSPDASPPRRARHDSPDASPPRRARHDSPDASPPRQRSGKSGKVPSKGKWVPSVTK